MQKKVQGKDFKVDVMQELWKNRSSKPEVSRGTFEFSPPRNLRLELVAKIKSGERTDLIVSNGKELWQYNSFTKNSAKFPPDIKQLEYLNLLIDPASLATLFDVSAWTKDAKEAPPAAKPDVLPLVFTPKSADVEFVSYLLLNEKSGWVEEVRIVYQNGNRARMELKNYTQTKVAKSRFDFVPPPGTYAEPKK